MTSSVTRTISAAIIALELNGHLSYVVPIMVCVLSSYVTSDKMSEASFFEMLSVFRGISAKGDTKS